MEMKQKEQEINKRKKRLLWKEKRMKETVLNAMNPVEREIFEKELQKVHLKKSTALNDIGKTVWDTKKIRELLDQDAELEEIKRFFDENQLKPNHSAGRLYLLVWKRLRQGRCLPVGTRICHND